MTSLAHRPAPSEIRMLEAIRVSSDAGLRLRLVPSGDGWSLIAPDGKLVFNALGTQGRRRCLEFARAEGVLAVLS
jgi:hypothetical protein